MKFTVSQSALVRALAVVAKGMSTNSTMPLLSGVYLKAADGTLEVQTNDYVIAVRHRLPANVEEPGETVVAGKVLTNIAKALPDAAISFEGDAHSLSLSCEKSHFRLNALDPADWTAFPSYDPDMSIDLPSDALRQMVDRVYRVTSRESSRPVLQGIYLTVENNTIRLVATDSYRLAVVDTSSETSGLDGRFEAIIPGGVFHDVTTMPGMTDTITVATTESQVIFGFGTTTFIAQKIRGRFTDYRQILPKSHKTSVTIHTDEFASALKRMSVIAQASSSVRLEVVPADETLKVSASSPDQGDSFEYLPVEAEGEPVSTAYNYHYLSECVSATADRGEVTLQLSGGNQPGLFLSNAKINYLYVLMPVWI